MRLEVRFTPKSRHSTGSPATSAFDPKRTFGCPGNRRPTTIIVSVRSGAQRLAECDRLVAHQSFDQLADECRDTASNIEPFIAASPDGLRPKPILLARQPAALRLRFLRLNALARVLTRSIARGCLATGPVVPRQRPLDFLPPRPSHAHVSRRLFWAVSDRHPTTGVFHRLAQNDVIEPGHALQVRSAARHPRSGDHARFLTKQDFIGRR